MQQGEGGRSKHQARRLYVEATGEATRSVIGSSGGGKGIQNANQAGPSQRGHGKYHNTLHNMVERGTSPHRANAFSAMQHNDEINLTYTRYGQAEARPQKSLLMGQTEAKQHQVTTIGPLQCATRCPRGDTRGGKHFTEPQTSATPTRKGGGRAGTRRRGGGQRGPPPKHKGRGGPSDTEERKRSDGQMEP